MMLSSYKPYNGIAMMIIDVGSGVMNVPAISAPTTAKRRYFERNSGRTKPMAVNPYRKHYADSNFYAFAELWQVPSKLMRAFAQPCA